MKADSPKKPVRRLLRILVWLAAGVLSVIILAVAALQFPGVQRYIAQKAVETITDRTHTRVEIGSVSIAFTHSIVLKDIFVESRQHDTLLAIQSLAIDVNLLGLLTHDINVHSVRVDSLTAHITRSMPDSSFNFDFILDALGAGSPAGPNPDTSAGSGWGIKLGTFSFKGIRLTYDDQVSGMNARLQLGSLEASIDRLDPASHRIAVKSVRLENTSIVVAQQKRDKSERRAPDAAGSPWVFSLDEMVLNENSAQYDVRGTPTMRGVDANHLRLDGLTMSASNIYYGQDSLGANIHHTALREHSGFELRELSGGFALDSRHAQLSDFILETPTSRVRQNILLRYSSLADLQRHPGAVNLKATIEDSHVSLSDVLLFTPSLPLKNKPGARIRFSARLTGSVQDLSVNECRLAAGDSTTVNLSGSIRGLPRAETAYYELNLEHLASSRSDIRALVADTLLPENIVVPRAMSMSGYFKGTLKNFSASSAIATSIGNVNGNLTLNSGESRAPGVSQWKTDFTLIEFNVGSLLGIPETLGPFSLKASAAGTGLSLDDMNAKVNLEVEKAVVNGYPYRRLSLEGTCVPKFFEVKGGIQDSNLALTFTGTLNDSGANPAYNFTGNLKGADLQRLRLTTDDIRVSGLMTADFTGREVDSITGNIDVRNVVIIKNRKRYLIDSLVAVSIRNEKGTHIGVESTFLNASFDGTIAPGDLPAALKEHLGRYFTLHEKSPVKASKAQAFTFHVELRNPRIFTEVFFPQLEQLTTGVIEGSYDSRKMSLNIDVNIGTVGVQGFDIDSLNLTVNSDTRKLQASVRVGSIADELLHLTNFRFTGGVEHDSIALAVQTSDGDGNMKMRLAGVCTSVPDGYQFRFLKDGVVFQDSAWSVPADNTITFGSGHFIAHDLVLKGAEQSISIKSAEDKTRRPPLTIGLSHFKLGTLSRVVERDSGLVRGILDGTIVLRNLDKQMAFTSDLTVKDFAFVRMPVGDIVLKASNQTADVYDVGMVVSGNDNDIALKGQYRSKEGGSEMDLHVDIRKMNLASIEPFTNGSVQRLTGSVSGEMDVSGTMKKPSISGNLSFVKAAFNPTMLGSYLRADDGDIVFDRTGIHFGSFELIDTLGNKASFSANLLTENYRDFTYDCRLHSDKFLLMNKPASRDALYYGRVFLDSDVLIGGNRARTTIRMDAQLDKGTDLALVLPESETDLQRRRGIVRFVDVKNPADPIMSRRKQGNVTGRDTTRAGRSTLDFISNIQVDKDARLRILIDPIAGDSLVIRGEASFSVGLDQGGKLTVTGRYEILEGTYQLSFGDFIRREFAIQKGSSLTWFGSVTDANVDITAIYTAKTSALELVQDQLVGLTQEERNKYKQELRIQVYLIMDGRLLEPNIHFRLDLPPEQRGVLGGSVYAKLNEINSQESELNKQVFALLVLGRFLSSSPLASVSDGGGLSGLARSSVSQILTQQLNRLSESVIKGVSLNVGVESYQDYSTGTAEGRTQLQLALSKQLFDERVTVQVGGNVDLEGRRSQQNSFNNFAGDVMVAYKMSEDGRWQLQVFRKNTFAGAIEGDLVETGVGIVFTIDYDKLFGFTLRTEPDKEDPEDK